MRGAPAEARHAYQLRELAPRADRRRTGRGDAAAEGDREGPPPRYQETAALGRREIDSRDRGDLRRELVAPPCRAEPVPRSDRPFAFWLDQRSPFDGAINRPAQRSGVGEGSNRP